MLLVAVSLGLIISTSLQDNAPAQRLVAASNVRLRAEPQTTAEERTRLPLGALVTELEASDGSVEVIYLQ